MFLFSVYTVGVQIRPWIMAGRKPIAKKSKSVESAPSVTESSDHNSVEVMVTRNLADIRQQLEPLQIPVQSEVNTCSNCVISLGNNIYVSAGYFKNKLNIHIRYWSENKPTKNGVTLTPQRWLELYKCLDDLTNTANEVQQGKSTQYTYHLGGNWYVSVDSNYPCVNIRRFWMPPGAESICATRNGITLSFLQFNELKTAFTLVESCYPELKDLQPCYMGLDHQSLLGALQCTECSPNGY